MKRGVVFIISVLLLAAVGYGIREYFRTNKDLSDEPVVARLTAPQLTSVFEKNAATANRLYTDKVIAVSGRVTHLEEGKPVIITLGEEGLMSSIQCSMDSTHSNNKMVKVGDSVTIKGLCIGATSEEIFGTDVKLSRCVLEKK